MWSWRLMSLADMLRSLALSTVTLHASGACSSWWKSSSTLSLSVDDRSLELQQKQLHRVIARVQPVHAMNAEQRQTAADLWTKSTDLSRRSACRQLGNYIHPPLPFIITQPESWYSFYHPVEGRRLSRPRWLLTHPDYRGCSLKRFWLDCIRPKSITPVSP